MALAFDRPFDLDPRAWPLVGGRNGSQADRLLEDRAPAVTRQAANLAAARCEDGTGRSIGRRRDRGRQVVGAERAFDSGPLDGEPNEPPRRPAALRLALERELADVIRLVEGHEPSEPDLERRIVLLGVQRVARRRVVDLEEDE